LICRIAISLALKQRRCEGNDNGVWAGHAVLLGKRALLL
jgi:hypothetical protein